MQIHGQRAQQQNRDFILQPRALFKLIGQGVVAAQKTLVDKPELCELIVKQVMDKKNGVEPEEAKEEKAPAAEVTEPAEAEAVAAE